MAQKSREYIRKRFELISDTTGEPDKKKIVLRKMAYEFGVDYAIYNSDMSDKEIIELTFRYQICPSQLEEDLEHETYSRLF